MVHAAQVVGDWGCHPATYNMLSTIVCLAFKHHCVRSDSLGSPIPASSTFLPVQLTNILYQHDQEIASSVNQIQIWLHVSVQLFFIFRWLLKKLPRPGWATSTRRSTLCLQTWPWDSFTSSSESEFICGQKMPSSSLWIMWYLQPVLQWVHCIR